MNQINGRSGVTADAALRQKEAGAPQAGRRLLCVLATAAKVPLRGALTPHAGVYVEVVELRLASLCPREDDPHPRPTSGLFVLNPDRRGSLPASVLVADRLAGRFWRAPR